jgi:hypothetical protein
VTKGDVDTLRRFFDNGRTEGGSFDFGIQFALERMLVDPDFLLRVYRDPAKPKASASPVSYPLTDTELASRLSFFLWSSVPDDHLLTLAERGELHNPATLDREVRRMLADPRATGALVDDFAAQWLNLRRVDEVVVDPVGIRCATTACKGSRRKPRCLSPARCMIVLWDCWTRTTPSSTKGSRGSTEFRGFTGAASGG